MTPDGARVLLYMSGDLNAMEWAGKLDTEPGDVRAFCERERLPLAAEPNERDFRVMADKVLVNLIDYGAAEPADIAESMSAPLRLVWRAVALLYRRGLVHMRDDMVVPGRAVAA